MQLSPPGEDRSPPGDVPSALRTAAARLGHRPAVTVLLSDGRQEQSVASLAQWAAKGAHFLELDLGLGPGDRLRLVTPPSWTMAAVALAAWWAGVTVALDGDADVLVRHEQADGPDAGDVLWLGDAPDGAPTRAGHGEAWVHAVQALPDQPPTLRGTADGVAVVHAGVATTQRSLLAAADRDGEGTLGITLGNGQEPPPSAGLLADVAVRPLVVGRPTVVLRGVDPREADGDRVVHWR